MNHIRLAMRSVQRSHIIFVPKVKGVLTIVVLFVSYCLHYLDLRFI
jgi:flagellar biosynthesis protein FliQ